MQTSGDVVLDDAVRGAADHGTAWEAVLTKSRTVTDDPARPFGTLRWEWLVLSGEAVIARMEADHLPADAPRELVREAINALLRRTRPGF